VRHRLDCLKLELLDGPGIVLIAQWVRGEGGRLVVQGDPLDEPGPAAGHGPDARHGPDAGLGLLGLDDQTWARVIVLFRSRSPHDLASHPIDDHRTSQRLAKPQTRRPSYVQIVELHRDRIGWVVKSDLYDQRYLPGVPGLRSALRPKRSASHDQIVHSALKVDRSLGGAYLVVLDRHPMADVNPTSVRYPDDLENVLDLGPWSDQTTLLGDRFQAQETFRQQRAEWGDLHRSEERGLVHLAADDLRLNCQKNDHGRLLRRSDGSLQNCSGERLGNRPHGGFAAGDRLRHEIRSPWRPVRVADGAHPRPHLGVPAWPADGARARAAVPYSVVL
jgi:hypothetical protein